MTRTNDQRAHHPPIPAVPPAPPPPPPSPPHSSPPPRPSAAPPPPAPPPPAASPPPQPSPPARGSFATRRRTTRARGRPGRARRAQSGRRCARVAPRRPLRSSSLMRPVGCSEGDESAPAAAFGLRPETLRCRFPVHAAPRPLLRSGPDPTPNCPPGRATHRASGGCGVGSERAKPRRGTIRSRRSSRRRGRGKRGTARRRGGGRSVVASGGGLWRTADHDHQGAARSIILREYSRSRKVGSARRAASDP